MRFGDDDTSIRWVQWYFTEPDAPVFHTRHRFGSTIWARKYASPDGPGEVWPPERIWVNGRTPTWPWTAETLEPDSLWEDGFNGIDPLPSHPIDSQGRPIECVSDRVIIDQCPIGVRRRLYVRCDIFTGFGPIPKYGVLDYDDVDSWRGSIDMTVVLPTLPPLDFQLTPIGVVGAPLWALFTSGCQDFNSFSEFIPCGPPFVWDEPLAGIPLSPSCWGLPLFNTTFGFRIQDVPFA